VQAVQLVLALARDWRALAWNRPGKSRKLARQAQPGAQVQGWWQVVREQDWRLLAWKRLARLRNLARQEPDWRVLVWWQVVQREQPGQQVLEVVQQEQQRERLSLSRWRVPVSV
jgi:hypothetical protein